MKKQKFLTGIIIFTLGLTGVFSMLAMKLPMDQIPEEALDMFSPQQLQMLMLLNPTILLLLMTLIGMLLYDKVNFRLPIIESFVSKEAPAFSLPDILKTGAIGGAVAGVLIILVSYLFQPYFPGELIELQEQLELPAISRILYGGILEEILIRFGVMTLIVWLIFKISGKLNPAVYWIGIFLSAVIFGLGHLPTVYQAVGTPSTILLIYIIFGNLLAGLIFGWLYWKKGLESAMVAHMMAHVVMMILEPLFGVV